MIRFNRVILQQVIVGVDIFFTCIRNYKIISSRCIYLICIKMHLFYSFYTCKPYRYVKMLYVMIKALLS